MIVPLYRGSSIWRLPPRQIADEVGADREGAIFISKSIYGEGHFPAEKILHVYKLRP